MQHKYQFYISFNNKINTAAIKAVQDCASILSDMGYKDVGVDDLATPDEPYKFKLMSGLLRLFFAVKPHSIIAIQYPLLSGNSLFRYFIKAARFKKIKFLSIVHDIEELRTNSGSSTSENADISALKNYDCIIVHNEAMQRWLTDNGIISPIINLHLFDYLAAKNGKIVATQSNREKDLNKIVFAGNLSKSGFVYALKKIGNWEFNLYGPNYLPEKGSIVDNISWKGVMPPEEIVFKLDGAFGLIWDGDSIEHLDEGFGNYLKYNNPHKLSLYLAAGIPVIAPKEAAVGKFITDHQVGFLVDSLTDLENIKIDKARYEHYRRNALELSVRIKNGEYLEAAVQKAESILNANQTVPTYTLLEYTNE